MLLICCCCCFFFFFVTLTVAQPTSGPTYCTRANGLYNVSDGGVACLQSSVANVKNSCYTCQITGPAPYNARCGSLYELGATTCNNLAVYNAAAALCGGTSFTCTDSPGSDWSQLLGTPTTPTAPNAGLAPSASPTSGVSRVSPSYTLCFVTLVSSLLLHTTLGQ